MAFTTDQVMTAFMNYLYSTITDGKEEFDKRNAQERFITWCLPGIPIDPKELRFTRRGLIGEGATAEERERDTRLLLQQAGSFSRLVDFVPEMTGVYGEDQQLVAFHRNEDALSRVYERTLTQSQVPKIELTEEENKQIDRIEAFLYRTFEEEDPISGKKTIRKEDGPALVAYRLRQQLFERAFDEFNNARIEMEKGVPGAVLTFATKGVHLREKVKFALEQWETGGAKSRIEDMMEQVLQITQRSMVLWKGKVRDRYDNCRIMDDLGEFMMTTLIPSGFAGDDSSFTQREFTDDHVHRFSEGKSTEFSASGGLTFGLALKADGKTASEGKKTIDKVDNVKITFKVAQIPLSRPWFDPTFLNSRAWRLRPDAADVTELSDGGDPAKGVAPKGSMPAYPTSVIFVRDVEVKFSASLTQTEDFKKTIEGGGSVGWGPFSSTTKFKSASTTSQSDASVTTDGFRIPGLQIIGFRCHLLHQSPNPVSSIKDWI